MPCFPIPPCSAQALLRGSSGDWHRIVAFGRVAESAKSLTKGAYVEVQGEMQSREYTSQSDGGKRRVWEVRARSITKLERTSRASAENLGAAPAEEEVPA